jgi:hypothetical protein
MLKHHTVVALVSLSVAGAFVSFLAPASAAGADARQEWVTAAKHAGLAGNSGNIMGVHTHLHHTLNCLEGPKGADFDAKEENPCAGMGAGAIADTTDASVKATLQAAVKSAQAGVMEKDLSAAQKQARDTEVMLNGIGK